MLRPGTRVGSLRIEALIGRGAMGEVFRATQVNLKRLVAVKRIAEHLLSTPEATARFEREAQCLAKVQSPYVIGVHDFGLMEDDQGQVHYLLVMELVDGARSLRSCMEAPLRWQDATGLILQVARGLAAAAEFGVVHRDVKPHNIILSSRGIAKLVDFGLARSVDSTDLTTHGTVLGTPAYMPPEACRGQVVDGRGDLYSLGVTWYQLIAGRTPFLSDNTPGMLRAHVDDTPPRLTELAPQVPPRIAELVHRCLEKNPIDRPANAVVLIESILRLADQGLLVPEVVVLPEENGLLKEPTTAATRVASSSPRDTATLHQATAPTQPALSRADATANPPRAVTPAQLQPGTLATAPTLVNTRPLPSGQHARWSWWLTAAIVLLAVGAFVLQTWHTSFAVQRRTVDAALSRGDYASALRLADALVAVRPGQSGPLALEQDVVTAEVDHDLAQDGVAAVHDLVQSRLAGRPWLDGEMLATRVELHDAIRLADDGQGEAAEAAFVRLLARHPQNLDVLNAFVSTLHDRSGSLDLLSAAVRLAELQDQPSTVALDVLRRAQREWGAGAAVMSRVRTQLIRHCPDQIPAMRLQLDGGTPSNPNPRLAAFQLLDEAHALSEGERLQWHVRNLVDLDTGYAQFSTSLAWLQAERGSADWQPHLVAAHLRPITDVVCLHHWPNDATEPVIALLASSLADQVRTPLLQWLSDKDESLRYNAWILAHRMVPAVGVDDFAFHAATLVNCDPDCRSPALSAALAYFAGLSGSAEAARGHQALLNGEKHVQDELTLFERNLPRDAGYVRETLAELHQVTVQLQTTNATGVPPAAH